MKIQVNSGEYHFNILLPTGLIFSRGTVWLFNRVGRKYAGNAMNQIPPEALNALFAEFRRIKRKHGSWDLVEVESASGEKVIIRL